MNGTPSTCPSGGPAPGKGAALSRFTVSRFPRVTRVAAVMAVPAILAFSVAVPRFDTITTPGGGWSGLWLSNDAATTPGTTLKSVRTMIGADTGAAASLTGAGVGVALIDTGVAAVPGLPASQIVNGPDLSFESQSPSLRYLDTYGHGTHMAGIIVGNDPATGTKGLAPGVKLTSLKLGTANGAVDVSQVIAAVDWVVAHRNDDPANKIRVLNMSYGSGGSPYIWSDPLVYAVQRAWKAGIVVVAAAGNDGNSSIRMANPASDQFVIAVGAATTNGTLSTADDVLSSYTNMATAEKTPELMAPGQSIVSLRVPGSNVDNTYPAARVGSTLFRGSGTSQAAAVTSAAVALILQAKPTMTADQVKFVLRDGTYVPNGIAASRGIKEINVNAALSKSLASSYVQNYGLSTGTGALDDARGTSRVVNGTVALSGQSTIFGPFNAAAWVKATTAGTAWSGGSWMGTKIAGDGWTGTSFASKTWGSATWTGKPWSGSSATWIDPAWSGRFWAAGNWSSGTWTARFWASEDWATSSWD